MENNDNNNLNKIPDNNEETISIEERNVFQDEFYPINYEIQNNSGLNDNKDNFIDSNKNMINEDIVSLNNVQNNTFNEINDIIDSSYEIPKTIENKSIISEQNNNYDLFEEEKMIEDKTPINEQIISVSQKPILEDANNDNILTSSINEDGKYKKKTIIFYFIIGVVVGLIILFTILFMNSGKIKTVNCSYENKDDVYTETEEYIITFSGNEISYIEGIYIYKTIPENSKQLEIIREQKIPVIVNSNGIDGFTHVFEIGDSIFKAYSYYDYEIMNFDIVDKNDPNITPISYINIDSSKSYKKMKKDLENRGFKCGYY